MEKVVVVGLGRLGAPMAAVFAASGRTVVGIDVSEFVVQSINSGHAPVVELGLDEVMVKASLRLSATQSYEKALGDADITFVVVPTPTAEDGSFSLEYVLAAIREIGVVLGQERIEGVDKRHVVVITSTVMPGSTMGPIKDALESSSGLTVGKQVGLCYSPEFIALGSVIKDLSHPDMILIGESDVESGDKLLAMLHSMIGPQVPVARMDPTSAEVAKLAVNTFVTTKISYANMLAEICERLPGADAQKVTAAVGLDSRIGRKYLKPGAPFGGPCFPRDNAALIALANRLGVSADIAAATDAINRRQLDRVLSVLDQHRQHGNRLAVLGLSYKPGTPVRDEAFGVSLAARCASDGYKVVAWDPMCRMGPVPAELETVPMTDSLAECLEAADIAVIATPWPQLLDLHTVLNGNGGPKVIIDCWQMVDVPAHSDHRAVLRLGLGPTSPSVNGNGSVERGLTEFHR